MKEKEEIPDWCYDVAERVICKLNDKKGIDISSFDVDIRIEIEDEIARAVFEGEGR